MEQIKIGKFISTMRKEQNLTQRELADKLNISDKAVSKWETGKGLPEVALMLPLCEELKISVNELLSGERLSEEDYFKRAEENMMDLVREKEESKKKLIVSGVVGLSSTSSFLVIIFIVIALTEVISVPLKVALTVFGGIIFLMGIGVALVLDREAGTFECAKCHTRFVPDMAEYVMAPHTVTRRRLRCPECGEKSYCRKRLTR